MAAPRPSRCTASRPTRPRSPSCSAAKTGDDVDKFARAGWHDGPGGLPILDDCPNWLAGRVVAWLDAGDHDAILLEPFAAAHGSTGAEFTFHRAKRIDAGHAA